MAAPGLKRELRLRDLVFFNICAIAGLRWLAAAAHAGPGTLLLWLIAALCFFVPSYFVVARLAALFPQEGGMYIWTRRTFGDLHGFLCSWFYFISNLLYFPSLLLSGITMTAYVFGSRGAQIAEDRAYALPVTLAVLWALLLANFFGLRVAKWIAILCGASTFVIGGFLIALATAAGMQSGSATRFHVLPGAHLDTLNLWSQIALAFTGLELAPIVSGEIRNPRRDVPRAAVISGIACALFYMAGTAAMLVLARPESISPMTGLAETGATAAARLHLPFVSVLFATLISLGVAGQVCTYMAGNMRLPYAIGLDHYLPAAFARLHPRWRTPWVSLLVQAVVATVFLVMAQVGDNMRAAYQIMVDMVVIATLIPFVYIFGSGLRFASRLASISGLTVTLIAIGLSIVPPPESASALVFELKVVGGCAVFAVVGWSVFRRYRKSAAVVLACIMLAGCARTKPDPLPGFPLLMLWAWERPEDLRFLDPQHAGVAYLAETVTLRDGAAMTPRLQPLLVQPQTKLMAVVRIESSGASADVNRTAELVAMAARQPGVAALQIDYDARRSERAFYRAMARAVRNRIPRGMPLTMTALVSWCVSDPWIRELPVVDAVPMYFRMGPEPGLRRVALRNAMCQASTGLSIDELVRVPLHRRVFLFSPRPWTREALHIAVAEVNRW